MRRGIVALALALGAGVAARAETVACPDLAGAVQVATCPSEQELKYTFTGYCADNARMYDKDPVCASEQAYRKLKNIALWESRDGSFQGYVSCDLSPAVLKEAKASRISVSKQGSITRVACSYRDGIVFAQRTRAQCRVVGDGKCDSAADACKASCE